MTAGEGIQDVVPDALGFVDEEPGGAPVLVVDASTKPATSLERPNMKPPAGVRTSLSSHDQPTKRRCPWKRERLAKNWLVTWSQVALMYMRRARGKLYRVQRAQVGKRTLVLPV
jgi:hypothetical protein